nr:MAG TPA: hypothetical protein [Caudoviricetes sp.]
MTTSVKCGKISLSGCHELDLLIRLGIFLSSEQAAHVRA